MGMPVGAYAALSLKESPQTLALPAGIEEEQDSPASASTGGSEEGAKLPVHTSNAAEPLRRVRTRGSSTGIVVTVHERVQTAATRAQLVKGSMDSHGRRWAVLLLP